MKSTCQMLIPALAACGLMALAAGCEDSAARTRDTVQVNIAKASGAYEQASANGLDPADPAIRPLLQNILTSIGSMSGADPGQAAAAAMLSSSIHEQLGTLDLLQAEQLESEHRLDRLVIHGVVDLVGELSTLADVQSGFNGTDEQATLDHQRQAAVQALADLGKKLAELDGPIASLTAANDADTKQADQLKKEANALYGESMTLGHYEGFPTREQAVERRRAAEGLDRQIADRHSELEFTYEPERSLAQDRAEMNKALIADIDRAAADLKSFGELSTKQAQDTRTAVDGFAANVHTRLTGLEESMSGELAKVYEESAAQLEKAAVDAVKAGGTGGGGAGGAGGGSAAKVTVAGAQQTLARLYWTQARGLASHAAMLARLIAAGKAFGDPVALDAKLKATESAHVAAVNQAKAAITSARETLDQITTQSDAASVESIKSNLGTLLASLEGKPVDWSSLSPAPASPAAPPASGRGAAPAGNTPEAFLEALKKLDLGNPADRKRYWDMFQATSPAARSLVDGQRAVSDAYTELLAAMKQKFGDASTASLTQGFAAGASMGKIANPKIAGKNADRATVSYTSQLAQGKQSLELVRVGDRWLIDMDSMLKGPMMAGQGDATKVGEEIGKMADGIRSLTDRVNADEFSTPEEVIAELIKSKFQAAGMKAPEGGKLPSPGGADK